MAVHIHDMYAGWCPRRNHSLAAGAFTVIILVDSYALQWVYFSVYACAALLTCGRWGGSAISLLCFLARL
jgi:hypothetical protein